MRRPPLRYALECGPRALAAVMEIAPDEAARRLWVHRSVARTLGANGSFGTPARDIGEVLSRFGWSVEVINADGTVGMDEAAWSQSIAATAYRRAVERQSVAVSQPSRDPIRPLRGALTVRELVRAYERDVLAILVPGHALAARGGCIVAGGENNGGEHVLISFRVTPPTTPKEGTRDVYEDEEEDRAPDGRTMHG